MKSKIAVWLFGAALPFAAVAAPESYTIDPYHSFPHFEVDHVGVAKIRGRFDRTTGKIVIDRAARSGTVEVSIPTPTVTTGDNDRGNRPRSRDEHLRSADFFNVAEFPTMTYRGKAVKFSGEAPATVEGTLTLLGVTKPVALTVEQWKCGPDPRVGGKREVCGIVATGSIKRTEFGMKFGVPAIGDVTKLWIGIEALKE